MKQSASQFHSKQATATATTTVTRQTTYLHWLESALEKTAVFALITFTEFFFWIKPFLVMTVTPVPVKFHFIICH
jgi:hypothetical protein